MILPKTRSTSSQFLISSPNFYIRKGRPHGHRYGKKEGDHEYFIANQLKKKCKKREFLSIHDRFIRDARFRKNMIEMGRTEEVNREMDKLANEDYTHHATDEEVSVHRNNWWICSNIVGSDTDARRASSWFQRSIVYLASPQESRGWGFLPKLVAKPLPHLGGIWQDSWWHSSSEYHRDDRPSL